MRKSWILLTLVAVIGLVALAGWRLLVHQASVAARTNEVAEAKPKPAPRPLVRRLPTPNGQTVPLCPSYWDTPLGTFWFTDENPYELAFSVREQMASIYQTGEVTIRPGDIVLDVGAAVGTFTRIALGRGAAAVWAMEPNQANATCFAKTFAKEIEEGKVHLLKIAAWSAQGTLRFVGANLRFRIADAPPPNADESPAPAEPVVEITATTIDALVRKERIGRIDFIKMDIEGSEREALKGAAKVLAQQGPKLAIAIYHTNNPASRVVPDWVMIPHLILQMRPTYHVFANQAREEALFFDPTAHR
jgi:FkbM family methyltransferase